MTTICKLFLRRLIYGGTPLLLMSALVAAAPCKDDKLADIPNVDLQEIARGLQLPVEVANDGHHAHRLYILEQAGRIQIYDKERRKIVETPFLDIRERVHSGGEKGLLGIAFHPNYPKDPRFYLNYTIQRDQLYTIVAEYRANRDLQTAGKEARVLLRIAQPYGNHNGGQLAFGPDGYLYIGMGDGGSANDPGEHGQNLNSLLGAILRIDVNTQSGKPYGIPADNPYVAPRNINPETWVYRQEIWAYGLRNPWRFSFDVLTGQLWLGDVGQNAREEIDIIEKGKNYGWRIMEGDICNPNLNSNCNSFSATPPGARYIGSPKLTPPVFSYVNGRDGESITGGYVYRGHGIPGLCGAYVYADYVWQRIWALRYRDGKVTLNREIASHRSLAAQGKQQDAKLYVSSFGTDLDNELYVAAHQSGVIYRLVPAAPKTGP